jgi:hypothetical protein
MMIDVRQKGAEGERQVVKALEPIVRKLYEKHGVPLPEKDIIQRNQNQSAVGGKDLSNTFGLAIEIKRQESLSVPQWWRQCVAAAVRNEEVPVLLYRQNNKPWRCMFLMKAPLPACHGVFTSSMQVVAETSWEHFLTWFEYWVDRKIRNGQLPKV